MASGGEDFSARLIRVTQHEGSLLESGDFVYEVVHPSPETTKYNKLRVHSVDGGTVKATRADGPPERPRVLRFASLMVEKKDEPMSRPKPIALASNVSLVAPSAAPPSQVDYRAFSEMGQSMLDAIERDIQTLQARSAGLHEKLDECSNMSRRRIEQLEADLVRARKTYDDARALVALEIDDLVKQIDDAVERRAWLRSMPGAVK
jgi:hypothetical protein